MSRPWNERWFADCRKWRGEVLEGRYRHWCFEWDELPVDETTLEWDCCNCFSCKCGLRMMYDFDWMINLSRNGYRKEDYFVCPARRWWNFWKHDRWSDD